jgi:hypothetical protein
MSDDEFVQGYLDGHDPDSPEPSENRSHRYRHSFAIGRAELEGKALLPADAARYAARQAEEKDTRL